MTEPSAAELGAALLWLREHYDVGDKTLKAQVLKAIDAILFAPDGVSTFVTLDDMAAFRAKYLKPLKGGL
jgi:hypothetical protein